MYHCNEFGELWYWFVLHSLLVSASSALKEVDDIGGDKDVMTIWLLHHQRRQSHNDNSIVAFDMTKIGQWFYCCISSDNKVWLLHQQWWWYNDDTMTIWLLHQQWWWQYDDDCWWAARRQGSRVLHIMTLRMIQWHVVVASAARWQMQGTLHLTTTMWLLR